ncbi:hypothetical protein VNO77_33546 [Canavalia gladiata]|uniref:F-box domain-containing protein n=1 Tax=Canavalia gladiata TaxID=3824 RepID=A0AAN9KDI4_CANGL
MPRKSSSKHVSPYFKPGAAVEVTYDDQGFPSNWFSGTIVRCRAPDRFVVELHTLITDEETSDPVREVINLRQLRPQPPPENHRELKSGDRIEAFLHDAWWECQVTDDLGNERFGVYFMESNENMVFPREQLRIHRHWINSNWVPPIPIPESSNHKASMRGKERNRKLEEIMKERKRPSRRNKINDGDRDGLSDLPDIVLLHIMKFMDTKQAVQTSLLSKRWKNLCKRLTNLSFKFQRRVVRKFVSWILSKRDHSCSLLDLNIQTWIKPELLNSVVKYAVCHNVQHLTIHVHSNSYPNFEALPLIFSCHSLTSLTLSLGYRPTEIVLSKSMQLPALKTMCLAHAKFTATHNDCAEPFSNCPVLDTLILSHCYLHSDAKVLHISNSTLSSLTIYSLHGREVYQLAFSTPNLCSFNIKGFAGHQLSSTCNLPHVCEVHIDMFHAASSIIIRWLQVFTNVKKLTFSSVTLQNMLHDLSNPDSMCCQPPCFTRLESLKVKWKVFADISSEDVNNVVKYLLQNSPISGVDIIQSF